MVEFNPDNSLGVSEDSFKKKRITTMRPDADPEIPQPKIGDL
jgi:hypothetical protein